MAPPGGVDATFVDAVSAFHLSVGESSPHEGSKASLHGLSGKTVVLATLPHQEHGAEAYFVGIVVVGDHLGLLRPRVWIDLAERVENGAL